MDNLILLLQNIGEKFGINEEIEFELYIYNLIKTDKIPSIGKKGLLSHKIYTILKTQFINKFISKYTTDINIEYFRYKILNKEYIIEYINEYILLITKYCNYLSNRNQNIYNNDSIMLTYIIQQAQIYHMIRLMFIINELKYY